MCLSKKVYPVETVFLLDLFFTIFIMVDKLFQEKHIETTKPNMRTFDTAKENLDLILSLK